MLSKLFWRLLKLTIKTKRFSKQQQLLNYKGAAPQKKDFNHHFTVMMLALNLPQRAAENIFLRRTFACLDSSIMIPSAKTHRSRIRELYELYESELKTEISSINSKFSFSMDCWSSDNRVSYLALLIYYMTPDFEYRERLLAFEHIDVHHTRANLATTFMNILNRFNISLDRMGSLTTDNASNQRYIDTNIKVVLESSPGYNLNSVITRIPCFAHIIQLALGELMGRLQIKVTEDEWKKRQDWSQDDQKKLTYGNLPLFALTTTLAKVRTTARYINASNNRRAEFGHIQQREIDRLQTLYTQDTSIHQGVPGNKYETSKIPKQPLRAIIDCPTRWDSTYMMLARTHRLRNLGWNQFLQEHNMHILTLQDKEWKQIEYLLDITRPFCALTRLLGATKEPTLHLVYDAYLRLFQHLQFIDTKLGRTQEVWKISLRQGVDAAAKKLNSYWLKLAEGEESEQAGRLFGLAALLDPFKKGSCLNDPAFETYNQDYYYSHLRTMIARYDLAPSSTGITNDYEGDEFENFFNKPKQDQAPRLLQQDCYKELEAYRSKRAF